MNKQNENTESHNFVHRANQKHIIQFEWKCVNTAQFNETFMYYISPAAATVAIARFSLDSSNLADLNFCIPIVILFTLHVCLLF